MMDSYSKLKGKEPLKINLIPPDMLFQGDNDMVCSQADFEKKRHQQLFFLII